MSTDTTLEFRNNQDIFQPAQIQPANVNMFDAQIKNPQSLIVADTDKISLMNTVMAPNETLAQSVPQGMKMPAKGEINELSQGVAGVALEAASALFGSLEDKSEQPAVPQPELQNNLAMNHHFRPPSGMIAGL